MRLLFSLCALGLLAISGAQDEQKLVDLFESIKPQITVVIKEHPSSAELLEVTMLDPEYPKELLSQQVMKLGELLNVPPRGLFVGKVALQQDDPRFVFMKAKFAVNGLIEPAESYLRIQPILRAFAGAPAPYTLSTFNILFDGEKPTTKMVRSHNQPGVVEGVGRFVEVPRAVEFRIRLLSQEPEKITWPDRFEKKAPPPPPPAPPTSQPPLFWVLFAVAGLALILLVYFALLRIGRSARK